MRVRAGVAPVLAIVMRSVSSAIAVGAPGQNHAVERVALGAIDAASRAARGCAVATRLRSPANRTATISAANSTSTGVRRTRVRSAGRGIASLFELSASGRLMRRPGPRRRRIRLGAGCPLRNPRSHASRRECAPRRRARRPTRSAGAGRAPAARPPWKRTATRPARGHRERVRPPERIRTRQRSTVERGAPSGVSRLGPQQRSRRRRVRSGRRTRHARGNDLGRLRGGERIPASCAAPVRRPRRPRAAESTRRSRTASAPSSSRETTRSSWRASAAASTGSGRPRSPAPGAARDRTAM